MCATLFNHLITPNILKPLTSTQALYNTRLKYFGEDFTKVTCFSKAIFNPDKLEIRKRFKPVLPLDTDYEYTGEPIPEQYQKSASRPNEKRTDDIKRAKDKVFEIAYANPFQYFVTLTLNEDKISRTNKKEIIRALNVWFQNLVARSGFIYVFCPEYHLDGNAIHFHGLCAGNLKLFDSGTVYVSGFKKPMKRKKAERLGLQGRTVYNLENWKYGFSTVIALDEQKERTALYVTKYIVKDTDKIFGRFFYSGGKGLIRQVPTEYRNYPYSEFDGKEFPVVPGYLAVKYQTL